LKFPISGVAKALDIETIIEITGLTEAEIKKLMN